MALVTCTDTADRAVDAMRFFGIFVLRSPKIGMGDLSGRSQNFAVGVTYAPSKDQGKFFSF